jgi:hypothetical protein
MKGKALKKIMDEALNEVIKEVVTVPVAKDPALMTPDEKKREMDNVRRKTGSTDPTEPVDFVKKEGKLREMARTAIQYKVVNTPEAQQKLADLKAQYSEAKQKWFDAVTKGIEALGGAATIKQVADGLGLPQQRLNQFGIELYNAGIIAPAGMSNRELPPDEKIVPQHARNNPDSEDYEDPAPSLTQLFAPDAKGVEGDELFVGPHFKDDFGDPETGEGGDSLAYDVTDPTSMEPDETDDVERSNGSKPHMSIQDSHVLDAYDDLVRSIATIRSDRRETPGLYRKDGGDGFGGGGEKAVANLDALLARKRQKLADLLRQSGDLIQKHRDLGRLKAIIKQDNQDELPAEFADLDLDEATKARLMELAKIKK